MSVIGKMHRVALQNHSVRTSLARAIPKQTNLQRLYTSKAWSPVQEITLTEQVSTKLQRAFENMPSPYHEREAHLHQAFSHMAAAFSVETLGHIRNFGCRPDAPSVLHIRKLPTDPVIPNTPISGGRVFKKTYVSEACLSGIAQILGEPFGYASEKEGELFHTIVPVKGRENAISNEGSKTKFAFHTEAAYRKDRPKFIALYCLRSDHDKQAATTVVDVRAVLPRLSAETHVWLRQHEYSVRAPLSFEKAHGEVFWSPWQPILSGSVAYPEMLLRLPDMRARAPQAEVALSHLVKVLNSEEVVTKTILLPGEVLVINNRTAVHGRTTFEPRWDGMDRWLQRLYVGRDLRNVRGMAQQDFRILA